MSGNRTFTMIKPDAVIAGNTGGITKMIEAAGFKIIAMKKHAFQQSWQVSFMKFTRRAHSMGELVSYMSSGSIVPMILEKDNAVEDFRKLIGATDPKKAEAGTIRAVFAKSIDANAIHGSDSDANAEIESNFFFSQFERF